MSDKLLFRIVAGVSIFVVLVVVLLNSKVLPAPTELPSFTYFLPKLNAILNGTCSVLLLCSLWAIRRKKIALHKKLNLVTFALSSLFLISYIVFHYLARDTKFGDSNGDGVLSQSEIAAAGAVRYVYYVILITHIVLAAGVLPLILVSFYRGLQMQVLKHRRIVKWAFPIWLYVTVTGVIVYAMISPYYRW
jgi:putative membrane protein